MIKNKKIFFIILIQSLFLNLYAVPLDQVTSLEGFQDNPILGYGLVVGLKGTGDSKKNPQTAEMLSSIAENFGFYLDPASIEPKNTAVVLVTATLSPFSAPGQKLDVRVSSVYDAKSLEDGELIITPLLGGNNQIYAIAEGKLNSSKKSVNGTISLGATVQKSAPMPDIETNRITLVLKNGNGLRALSPIITALNAHWSDVVSSVDANRIHLKVPTSETAVSFVSKVLALNVIVPEPPRITIDSKSGMLVAGGNITVSAALVSLGNTKVQVQNTSPWGDMSSQNQAVKQMPATTTLGELVDALNAVGSPPSEIVQIIKLLHKNGNLKAEIHIE